MSRFKLFDKAMFEGLSELACNSSRKRANINIHEDYKDNVQRLFIAMNKHSYVKPHRHTQNDKWEFFLLLSGDLSFFIFDDDGVIIEKLLLSGNGDIKGIEIPPNTWHCTLVESEQACFFEVKNGPYEAVEAKDFVTWAPEEGEVGVEEFMEKLRVSSVGDSMNMTKQC